MAWQNERLSKDPFERRFWLVVQKQCKWPAVNQKFNMADKMPRKIASKPGLLMFASAAITLCSKVNTLLTFTGQRWRRNQFYFCCRGLNDMTNGWTSSNYSKIMPSLTRQEYEDCEAARCLHVLQHNNSQWLGLKSVKLYAKVLHK